MGFVATCRAARMSVHTTKYLTCDAPGCVQLWDENAQYTDEALWKSHWRKMPNGDILCVECQKARGLRPPRHIGVSRWADRSGPGINIADLPGEPRE